MADPQDPHGRRIRSRGRRTGGRAALAVAVSLAAGAAALAPAGAAFAAVGPAKPDTHTLRTIGKAPAAPKGAVRTGGVPSSDTTLHLSVNLAPRDPAGLAAFAEAVSTPGNAAYHHYLAKGQFAARFGATPQTLDAVEDSLRAAGLTPGKVSANGLSVAVSTTVGQAGKSLHTGFVSYRLAAGQGTGAINTSAPQLPGPGAAAVTGITGLDSTFRVGTDQHIRKAATSAGAGSAFTRAGAAAPKAATDAAATTATGPALCSSVAKSLGTDGKNYTGPATLAADYGMEHTPTTGAGATVGLLEAEAYDPDDISAFASCLGVHPSLVNVNVDGGPRVLSDPTVNVGAEATMDVEDVLSLAPGAHIRVYQGVDLDNAAGDPNPAFTDQDWLDIISSMVNDDAAQVLSISYGDCETDETSASLQAEQTLFQQAAAQGQSVLVSSGDDGGADCDDNTKGVEDPASQQWVTAVGGSTLTGTPGTTRATWNSGGGASGGGTSVLPQLDATTDPVGPADYQHGFTGPGYVDNCGAAAGQTCRQVPDVSALADPDHGLPMYYGGYWWLGGGTSQAAPIWASLVAAADTRGSCKATPAGFLDPALYAAAHSSYGSYYTDITSGTNKVAKVNIGFSAAKGYDLVTGLGDPKGLALTGYLCGPTALAPSGPAAYHPVAATWLTGSAVTANRISGVQVLGKAGVPSSGVTSVVLNVRASSTSGSGYLNAWADSKPWDTHSFLHWTGSKQSVSDLVTLPVSADGWLDFDASSGATLTAYVQGYYSTGSGGGSVYSAVSPATLLDSRSAKGVSTRTPLTKKTVTLTVAGSHGVAKSATAVALEVTATSTKGSGSVVVYPAGHAKSGDQDVSWTASSSTRTNEVIVPVGSGGKVSLYVGGTAHVVATVTGYFAPTGGQSFTSVAPARVLDTRNAIGVSTKSAVKKGGTISVAVAGHGGVPTGARSVTVIVTGTSSTASGSATVWANGASRPGASDLSWVKGQTWSQAVTVPLASNGKINLYTTAQTHLLVDVYGYTK